MDLITLLTVNFIDPVTKELLQFENLPTNLVSLSSTIAVDQLLNKKIDSLSDLKLYRSRLSEVILHSVYKQIKMAQNTYRKNVLVGDENATVFLDPDYVINTLLTDAGVLQNIEPVSPISEIMQSSRVIKTGIGGIPSRRSSKKEHRNIHPSQYGIISACSTPEYIDVGLTVHHTLTPVIINKYGSYGIKDITNLSGWNILALDESLTPFQNQVDSDRMILARTHSNQVIPISNSEAPLVATGAEAITSQLASPRFVQRAKRDGVITDVVPNKTLTVKYKNGSTEVFDILPRLSRTKRGSYIALEMQTLPINTKVKANQAIAFTKNFDENGIYCAGKNVFIAVMNYLGYSHEDSYVISKDLADETKTDIVSEVSIIIPPNTKIVKLEKEKNKIVENGEILVEFSYEDNLENYIETTELEDDEETSELYSMGDGTIKKPSPVTGEIIDIKVYINNKNSTDRSLISFHSKLVKETAEIVGKLEKSITDPSQKIVSTDNMDLSFVNIGKHKYKGAEFLGARIVYYIKEQKSLLEGDKMSNRYGAKGVISKILNPPPKGEITPRIDVFISPISILGRKNIAMLKELYLGKIFYFANSQLKDLADDPKITNDKIVKFITDLYMIIGPDKIAKSVSENLKQYGNGSQLRKEIKDNKFKLFCLVEPFDDIPFKNIKTAAEFIDIPLEEKVYIPELDQWTDTAVPVGVSYFLFLEHFSEVYANVRGTGKFVSLTRQPTKRKAQGGGQAIGRLDMYSFLTYGANNILTELLGPRSDEHKSKRDLYNTIIETGELPSAVEITKTGGTKDIFNLYITGLGLEIV
jgi:DNA-directed RNA polymerase subunit beta